MVQVKDHRLKPYSEKYRGVTGDMYIDFKVNVIILWKNNHCEWFYFVSPNWTSLRCEMINGDGCSFKKKNQMDINSIISFI